MKIAVPFLGVVLVCLVILTDVNCKRSYWKKKIHGSYNKYSKHHKKSIEKIQHHAPGLISMMDAKLQGHLSHHKMRYNLDKHRRQHLQDLGHRFNQQLVLPKPASTKQPDTTPMNIGTKHIRGHKTHLKEHKQRVHPIPLDLPKFKLNKKHRKKSTLPKKYRKYSKYQKKHGRKHHRKHH